MYYNPGTSFGVAVGKTTPLSTYALDISGNINISGVTQTNSLTTTGNVSIGKTSATQTLDVSGTMVISKTSYLTNISEKMVDISTNNGTANTYNLDYSQSSIFYIQNAPTDSSGTIKVNVLNVPSLTNTSQTYVITLLVKGTSGANCYCGNVYLTTQSTITGGTYYTPKFSNTPSVSSVTSSQLISQQIVYIYKSDISGVISSVAAFNN